MLLKAAALTQLAQAGNQRHTRRPHLPYRHGLALLQAVQQQPAPLSKMQSSVLGNTKAFQASRVTVARPTRVVQVIENRVALRFQRFGRKKMPFYRLVAIDSRDRRDGKPLEYLG